MKILLVQIATSQLGAGEIVYPLGLSRLSSLVPKEVDKRVLDMNICPDPWARLKEMLEKDGPEVVALSFRNLDPLAGHHASYLSGLKTAALLVRTLLPQARIIAGGPAFSLFGLRLMEEITQIDIGLVGEGELVFAKLLGHKIEAEKIPGILWRHGQKVVANPLPPKIAMDDIPPLDVRSFSPARYLQKNSYVAAMGIEGKRGCDLWCGYCLYPFLGGTCMRLRSPGKIVDEMQMLKERFGIELFHFTDSVVNRPREHFEEVCREIIRRKLGISWTGFFREDGFTPQNLVLAMQAGLIAVYFSADGMTDQALALMNKQLTMEDIIGAAKLTCQEKILTMCHFLVNLPGDTEESIADSGRLLDRLLEIHAPAGNLGAIIFNHVRLYPNTPLTRRLLRTGELPADTDLLYPVYYNPQKFSHVLHDFEARCHGAGVFSRLSIPMPDKEALS